jgi:hypothetical protein
LPRSSPRRSPGGTATAPSRGGGWGPIAGSVHRAIALSPKRSAIVPSRSPLEAPHVGRRADVGAAETDAGVDRG